MLYLATNFVVRKNRNTDAIDIDLKPNALRPNAHV